MTSVAPTREPGLAGTPATVALPPATSRSRLALRAAALPLAVFGVMLVALVLRLAGDAGSASLVLQVGLVLVGAPLAWRTLRDVAAGHFASDIVATMAMVTAVLVGEPLAGLVVVLMQSGGQALEEYAAARASSAVRSLEEMAPRSGHRVSGDLVEDIAASDIRAGDMLVVRPGELVPCDGVVTSGRSHLDTSRLTGEPLPETIEPGSALSSGTINLEGAFTMRATAPASESRYERIVELVRSAQASKAPLQRLADRYATWFTPLVVIVAGAAWAASGDAARALAVLVVATPCPLILATPVAIIGGVGRAAKRQVIVRHGGALEQLAGVRTVVLDKTGTVTIGRPALQRVVPLGTLDSREVLRLAAGAESASGHLLAREVVDHALREGLRIPPATSSVESAGRGVAATVDGRAVVVGSAAYVVERAVMPDVALPHEAGLRALVAVDGRVVGVLEFADRLREGVGEFVRDLRALGVEHVVMLSGDDEANTRAIAAQVGITEAVGGLHPEDKSAAIERLKGKGSNVLMVGDGTNDAPALSTADVGIALAGHGGGIAAEAADAVILVDDVHRVTDALRIGRRTLRIAKQSALAGLGLSAAAMVVAAFGYIPPLAGALLQEAIDVAVILNALRASGDGIRTTERARRT